VAAELPWCGRRIDYATYSQSGITSAYELKLAKHKVAIEQALYNRSSFARSYIVTDRRPSDDNMRLAAELGVGVLLATLEGIRILSPSPMRLPSGAVHRRLVHKITTKGVAYEHVWSKVLSLP